jgi:Na+/proline symporter
MTMPILSTVAVCFIILLGIGLYFCRRRQSIEDDLLGGRGIGRR